MQSKLLAPLLELMLATIIGVSGTLVYFAGFYEFLSFLLGINHLTVAVSILSLFA